MATALAAFNFFGVALGAGDDGDLKLLLVVLWEAGDLSDDTDDALDDARLDGADSESLSFTTALAFLQ